MSGETVLNVCFHGVGRLEREREPGEADFWVGRDQFLRILDEVQGWSNVALSFDDGNASDVEVALPALLDRGLTAAFFPLAGRLDQPGSLSSSDVGTLASHGMVIGSHGMSHRSWRHMDPATGWAELVDARSMLSEASGRAVEQASCPFGLYDRRALGALRQHGYCRVHTSDRRRASTSSWLQPRFSVTRGDTPESLRAEILPRQSLPTRALRSATCAIKRWR